MDLSWKRYVNCKKITSGVLYQTWALTLKVIRNCLKCQYGSNYLQIKTRRQHQKRRFEWTGQCNIRVLAGEILRRRLWLHRLIASPDQQSRRRVVKLLRQRFINPLIPSVILIRKYKYNYISLNKWKKGRKQSKTIKSYKS